MASTRRSCGLTDGKRVKVWTGRGRCAAPGKRPPLRKVNITVRQSRQSGVARATCPD
ncbi:MAG: hypothetical protein ACLRW4_04885 [Ruminococcus sp.]